MAHDIAKIDGMDAMFCVGDRDAAWHQLGQRVNETVKWQEAMQLAKLDWEVKKADVFSRDVQGNVYKLPDVQSVWRATNPSAYLGTVGTGYECIQNRHAFDWVDSLLEAESGAHYETAGALGNGERIWVMAKLPQEIRIKGTDDISRNYLLFTTAHDGSQSAVGKLCSERVVCANTLAIALGESGKGIKVKHTKSAMSKLDEAKRVMLGVAKDIQKLDEKLNMLATRRLTRGSMVSILDRLFPIPAEGSSETRRNNTLAQVLALFERNDGNAFPQLRGTAYNLLNAVTEFTDHYRTVRITDSKKGMTQVQARAQEAIFGTGEKFKSDAMVAIMDETKDAEIFDPVTFVPSVSDLNNLYNLQ